jgi:hypothetical protein
VHISNQLHFHNLLFSHFFSSHFFIHNLHKCTQMIVCFKSWHPSHQYRSDTGSMLVSSSKSDLMLPVHLRSWHSLQELTTELPAQSCSARKIFYKS